jgi:hypothetical protein
MLRLATLVCLTALLAGPAFAQVSPPGMVTAITDTVAADARIAPAEGDYLHLRTGAYVTGRVQITPSPDRPRYALVDGQRYELNQITGYRVGGREYLVLNSREHPNLPPLLVKAEEGRISLYRDPSYDTGAYFYRVAEGDIQYMTGRRLRADLADDPVAMYHLQREQLAATVGFASLLVGIGLVATGVAVQADVIEAPYSGVIIAGAGVGFAALVNAIVPGIRQQARMAAVRAYNR